MGTYVSCRLFVNACQSTSSTSGGVIVCSFWRPIRAMSLLKSPHSMCVWCGWFVICWVMFCWIIGMDRMSSSCDGI